jgi:hypothetical protein
LKAKVDKTGSEVDVDESDVDDVTDNGPWRTGGVCGVEGSRVLF